MHFPNEDAKQQCRDRLSADRDLYTSCEEVLKQLRCWLCSHCMILHTWKKSCKHSNVVIPRPHNGRYVDYLISGIAKPNAPTSKITTNSAEIIPLSLSLDMLNEVFHIHFNTIASIPPPCRLNFLEP